MTAEQMTAVALEIIIKVSEMSLVVSNMYRKAEEEGRPLTDEERKAGNALLDLRESAVLKDYEALRTK